MSSKRLAAAAAGAVVSEVSPSTRGGTREEAWVNILTSKAEAPRVVTQIATHNRFCIVNHRI